MDHADSGAVNGLRYRAMRLRDALTVMIAGDRMASQIRRMRGNQDGDMACSDVADQAIRIIDQAVISPGTTEAIARWADANQQVLHRDHPGRDSAISALQVQMMKQIRVAMVAMPPRFPYHERTQDEWCELQADPG